MHKQSTRKDVQRSSIEDFNSFNQQEIIDNATPKPVKRLHQTLAKIKKVLFRFVESFTFVTVMSVFTIYALFADDVRQLINDLNSDDIISGISCFCLGLFVLEIVLSSLAKPNYFLTFFFWLDAISTVSLLFDIVWVSNAIFSTGTGTNGGAQFTKVGRASRVGARAARVVRIVRLVRLIRIVKLYKAAQVALTDSMYQKHIQEVVEAPDDSVVVNNHTQPPFKSKNSINKELFGISSSQEIPQSLTRLEKAVKKLTINSATQVPNGDEVSPLPKPMKSQTIKQSTFDTQRTKTKVLTKSKTKGEKSRHTRLDELEAMQETNVGKELSILTTKRVILMVLSIIISIPLFTPSTYLNPYEGADSGIRTLCIISQSNNATIFNITLQNYVSTYSTSKNPLIAVYVGTYPWFLTDDGSDLRDSEKSYYNYPDDGPNQNLCYSIFNHRQYNQLNAILSIVNTIFVTLVLTAAALYFSKDSNDLVLYPLESMLRKVRRITINPLAATEIEEEDALLQEELKKRSRIRRFFKSDDEVNYETKILEKTILKLGALLALGFGEAGSNIIAQNMSKDGEVDPMIPGKKVMAIFGFCDIRNFTDATEVLQEGVMVFVNEIAEIVHSTIHEYSGAANKNIGDAFLLVWKLPDEEVYEDPDNPSELKLRRSIKVSQIVDMSIISFIKIIASIQKSKTLEKYSHNEDLCGRLPNYSVKMGFGLHVGWAIEGAIGSEYKIDASYLSPNVNMASRLEAATKQFGVPILISGSVFDVSTTEMKKQLRHIDTVTVKGSNQPVRLYTCDVDFSLLSIDKSQVDIASLSHIEKKKVRLASRTRRNEMKDKAFKDEIRIAKAFVIEKDLVAMRKPFTKEFSRLYAEGMGAYIEGDWAKAKQSFEITKDIISDYTDGPSKALLNYMKESGYKAPADWKGFRELTEK